MKGDFSRITFDPHRHYSGVRMQQGRVQLDADWNEQADILDHRIATGTRDLVGGSGAPEGSPGFRVLTRYALEFDGRDDYVLVEHARHLHLGAHRPFTLEAWAELRAGGGGGALLAAPGGTWLGVEADGTLTFRVGGGRHRGTGAAGGEAGDDTLPTGSAPAASEGPRSVESLQPVEHGRRVHLAASWDGTRCALYVDGRSVDAGVGSPGTAPDRLALGALLAGREASRFLAGMLEEVRVWSVARSEAEVRADMGHTPTGREEGLAACWVFHEGHGHRVNDLAGSGAVAVLGGGAAASRPAWSFRELRIGRGRYYVDGTLCENDAEVAYAGQPFLPGADLPAGDGRWLVYLDTFQRLLTSHEEPSLREVALGGPDTGARTQDVWQVRLLPEEEADAPEGRAPEGWRERVGASGARGLLAARREHGSAAGGNYLFRVEIHCAGGTYGWPRPDGPAGRGAPVTELLAPPGDVRVAGGEGPDGWHPGQLVEVYTDRTEREERPGDLALVVAVPGDGRLTLDPFPSGLTLAQNPRVRRIAGFKWSRDNGSVAFGVRSLDAGLGVASVHDLGHDASALALRDWVEIADDGYLLRARPTPLRRVVDLDRLNRRVVVDVEKGAALPPDLGQDPALRPVLRRWDAAGADGLRQGITPVRSGQWTDLADGVQVRFSGGAFRVGDFWTLPVRVVGASGIEWPSGEDGPAALPPQGVHHRYVPLARFRREGRRAHVEDLRTVFAPLTALGGDYVHRTGPQAMTGPLTVERDLTVGREALVRGGLTVEGELRAALPRRSVGTPQLRDGSVGTPQLRDRSVTYAKLAGDVGLIPPGAFIFGETPYPPAGYAWTGGHLSIPNDHPSWHDLPPLPYAHSARVHAVAATGVIYLFSERVAEVFRYHPAYREWELVTLIPRMRRDFAAAEVGGRIYLVGGIESKLPVNWVDVYDPDTGTWEKCSPLPTPRSALGLAAVEGFLYAVGGRRHTILGSLPTARNEVYEPLTGRWREVRPMATRRSRMAVATLHGKLYAVGGEHLEELIGRVTGLNEAYDPGADRWQRRRRMPSRRMSAGAAVVNGKLYVLGGETSERITVLMEEYDPATNGWADRPPLPLARKDFGALGLGGKVYALGGQTPHGPTHLAQELPLVTAYYPYRKLFDYEYRARKVDDAGYTVEVEVEETEVDVEVIEEVEEE